MVSQEIKDLVIDLRQKEMSYANIMNITNLNKWTVYRICKNVKLTMQQKRNIYLKNKEGIWLNEEIEFLKKHYSIKGPKYCIKHLNRTKTAIGAKASELKLRFSTVQEIKWIPEDIEFLKVNYPLKGLKFCAEKLNRSIGSVQSAVSANAIILKIDRSNSRNRHIIKKLEKNKLLANCKIHGETAHYNWKSNHSFVCQLCQQEKTKTFNKTDRGRSLRNKRNRAYRKNEIVNFIDRIRNRLNRCYFGLSIHFKDLGFTGKELRDHINRIKEQQNNCCPICNKSYLESKMNIEHIIPLATAKSKEEIIKLFALSNLSVMCNRCNSSKCKNNFDEWKNKKLLEKENIYVR